jgi:hypothetical protein
LSYFIKTVLPTLDAIGRINDALISIEGAGITPSMTIERIIYVNNLEIELGGCLPDTVAFCMELYGDDSFRFEHEAKVIKLEEANNKLILNSVGSHSLSPTYTEEEWQKELETEIRKNKYELRNMELKQAQKQIDNYVSSQISPEKRAAIAVIVLPAVRSLLELLSDRNLSMRKINGS